MSSCQYCEKQDGSLLRAYMIHADSIDAVLERHDAGKDW